MSRRIALLGTILGAALLILVTAHVEAGGKKSDSEVKVTATATKLDGNGKQVVTITLVHNKGWHSYANPIGNEEFDSNKTVVTVNAGVKPVSVKIDYPAGKIHKDKVIGDYKIYEDKVDIRATVQRAQGDSSPLEVNVRVQVCHDKGVCLLPAKVKLTLP